ncbi:hypothetical protein [Flavobacterium sp.]|uniref:hypothetical protein n=1 Tax=Flavobacterium sp. TaxID=239 RepID=UPI003751ED70
MRKMFIAMLLVISQLIVAQETENNKGLLTTTTYKYGHNGMELIVTTKKETIIISTFNSKLAIKDEIAEKIYNYYKNNKGASIESGDTVIINGDKAKVTGKCIVRKNGKLIVVEFYYEKIEWHSGLTELYKKNIG